MSRGRQSVLTKGRICRLSSSQFYNQFCLYQDNSTMKTPDCYITSACESCHNFQFPNTTRCHYKLIVHLFDHSCSLQHNAHISYLVTIYSRRKRGKVILGNVDPTDDVGLVGNRNEDICCNFYPFQEESEKGN